MNKRLTVIFVLSIFTMAVYAQWTPRDSLNLRRMLEGDGEIKINPNAVRQIDFGSFVGTPMMSTDKPALQYDTKLPFTDHSEIRLTLQPYTAATKFNYDPIYKRKIKVGPDTWRGDTAISRKVYLVWYTNWADNPFAAGNRESLEEIEGSGLRYNPFGERVNGMHVGTWTPTSTIRGISTQANGGVVFGGFDFNAVFTREFWDKSIEKRRNRTLEVLKHYGDSTTVDIKQEIIKVEIPEE